MIIINNKSYKVIELLFNTKSTLVYKTEFNNQFYIIKCYKFKFKNRWYNEIAVLKDTKDNPNIINLLDYCEEVIIDDKKFYPLVFEYYSNGDLLDYLIEFKKYISKNVVRKIFKQILNGVSALNKLGWSHRDLKLENILVTRTNPVEVKIIDFEYATKEKKTRTQVGTLTYMSPQILLQQKYNTRKNDIWSLGIILFLLYVGDRPYEDKFADNETGYVSEFLMAIKEKEWCLFWPPFERTNLGKIDDTLFNMNNRFCPDFKNLIQKMLNWSEKNRISLKDIRKHNFIINKPNNPQRGCKLCGLLSFT